FGILGLRILNLACEVGTDGVVATKSDAVGTAVAGSIAARPRHAGFGNDGTRDFPSAENAVAEAAGVREYGQLVHIIHIENVAAVEGAGALVVFQVERIGGGVEIGAAYFIIDLVRIGVIDFEAQTMPALLTQPNLQAVVAGGCDVGFLADTGESGIGPEQRVLRAGEFTGAGYLSSRHRRAERERVDRENDVLVPSEVAHVLCHSDQRRQDFTLNTDAELRHARSGIARVDRRHALGYCRQTGG